MGLMRFPGNQVEHEAYEKNRFKRYGLYRAEVLRTDDGQHRGRIQVRVLQMHPPAVQPTADTISTAPKESVLNKVTSTGASPRAGVPPDACPWAEPCVPFGGKKGGNSGHITLPYVGSTVWVMFEQGFSGKPIWMGSWLGTGEVPQEIAAATSMEKIRLIRTEFGHLLLMDDTTGAERCFLGVAPTTGSRIRFLELDEANQEVRLFNDPDGAGTGTGTRIYMTEDEVLISKGDPASNVSLQLNDSLITLKAGTTTITLNKSGDVTLSTGTNCTLSVTGNVAVNASGDVTLGTGAAQGVCLDSLLAIINTAYGIFDNHAHEVIGGSSAGWTGGPGGPAGTPATVTMVPPVLGVNSSSTVKAKL